MNRLTRFLNTKTKKALKNFNGLTLAEAEKELINKAVNKTAFDFVTALKETVAEYGKAEIIGTSYKIINQKDIIKYLETVTKNEQKESVYVLFIDAKNKIIAFEKVAEGTLTQTVLYPREVIKKAICYGALSIVIAHNHPSGDPHPSQNDNNITRILLYACKSCDIVLLDHLIIGNDDFYSYQEKGFLKSHNQTFDSIVKKIID
jgi:DNA repair protein RadC